MLLDEMVGLYWLTDSKYSMSSNLGSTCMLIEDFNMDRNWRGYIFATSTEGNRRRVGVALEMQREWGNQVNQILTMKMMPI